MIDIFQFWEDMQIEDAKKAAEMEAIKQKNEQKEKGEYSPEPTELPKAEKQPEQQKSEELIKVEATPPTETKGDET